MIYGLKTWEMHRQSIQTPYLANRFKPQQCICLKTIQGVNNPKSDCWLWTQNECQGGWLKLKTYLGSLRSESGINSPNPGASPALYDQSSPRAAKTVRGLFLLSLDSSLPILSTYPIGQRDFLKYNSFFGTCWMHSHSSKFKYWKVSPTPTAT